MEVVDKIESLSFNDYTAFTFRIDKRTIAVMCRYDGRQDGCVYQTPFRTVHDRKIDAVYEGVIGFINWYNEQKQ